MQAGSNGKVRTEAKQARNNVQVPVTVGYAGSYVQIEAYTEVMCRYRRMLR